MSDEQIEVGMKYGPWAINYDPPPIPVRTCDWHFTHEDDDGAPDGSTARSGHGESLQDCLNQIFDLQADEQATLQAELDAARAREKVFVKAVRGVIDATSSYLPPDGISQDDCVNRVIGATDNREVFLALLEIDALTTEAG